MKKLVALLLLITLTAVMLTACNNATAAEGALPTLNTGRYYLDGDESTGVYIDVTENYVYMGGDKLYDFWDADYRKTMPDVTDEDEIAKNVGAMAEESKLVSAYNYAAVKLADTTVYALFYVPGEKEISKDKVQGQYYNYTIDGKITLMDEYTFEIVG